MRELLEVFAWRKTKALVLMFGVAAWGLVRGAWKTYVRNV